MLGQRVDSLGITTSEEKIAAISALRFPQLLRDLERFLGLTGWLRASIPKYAQRSHPLQERKTYLIKEVADSKGTARQRRATRLQFEPSKEEIAAFKDLKNAFTAPTFLRHFDASRQLFVDIDALKVWGFAAIVYHVRNHDPSKPIVQVNVEPIISLSKMLS